MFLLAWTFGLDTKYSVLSIIVFSVAINSKLSVLPFVTFFSNCSYEIFLLHGMFIVYFVKISELPLWVSIATALSCTVASASVVSLMVSRTVDWLRHRQGELCLRKNTS